jgi:hypothetical protein
MQRLLQSCIWRRRVLVLVDLIFTAACAPQEAASEWVEINATLAVDGLLTVPTTKESVGPVTMSLAEAQASLPFVFSLPGWAPEGFVLQDEVDVTLPTDESAYASITLTWQNASEESITLRISPTDGNVAYIGGAGGVEQMLVNGQPATLARRRVQGLERLLLSWKQTGLTYTLSANGAVVSAEDLIRMAESVR